MISFPFTRKFGAVIATLVFYFVRKLREETFVLLKTAVLSFLSYKFSVRT